MDESELKGIKNLGKKSLEEIKSVMEEIGYPIGNEEIKDKKEVLSKKIAELKKKAKDDKWDTRTDIEN